LNYDLKIPIKTMTIGSAHCDGHAVFASCIAFTFIQLIIAGTTYIGIDFVKQSNQKQDDWWDPELPGKIGSTLPKVPKNDKDKLNLVFQLCCTSLVLETILTIVLLKSIN
jgi:hypothetical protein